MSEATGRSAVPPPRERGVTSDPIQHGRRWRSHPTQAVAEQQAYRTDVPLETFRQNDNDDGDKHWYGRSKGKRSGRNTANARKCWRARDELAVEPRESPIRHTYAVAEDPIRNRSVSVARDQQGR
jgi:hypothetical protein